VPELAGAAWLAGMIVGGFDAATGGGLGRAVGGFLGERGMAIVDGINTAVCVLGWAGGAYAGVSALRGRMSGALGRGMGTKGTGSVIEVEPTSEVPKRGGAEPYWKSRPGVHYIKSVTGAVENHHVWNNDPYIGRKPDLIQEQPRIWHESKNAAGKVYYTTQLRETADLAARLGYA
jgi:hypothetical protein